jgi:hypothetical protein
MTTNAPNDIEKTLLSLSPKAVPPGLRAGVLESALKKRQGLLMTTGLWAAAAACVAIIAVAVLGDAAVTRAQNDDLRALLNGSGLSRLAGEETGTLPAEFYGEISDLERAGLERMAMTRPAIKRKSLQDVFAARERLKGWLDHEDEGTQSPD